MPNFEELLETGLKFHGHKCPAMPIGIKARLAAMKALGSTGPGTRNCLLFQKPGKDMPPDVFWTAS